MTGEITLRGKVLPIGGLKEKLLAAHRAGIKHVIIPKDNEKDLVDIPTKVREDIKITPVEIVDEVNYSLDPNRVDFFYKAVRRFFPDLKDGELQPGYTGVRPKLSLKQATSNDFIIQGKKDHGVEGLINLFGIESPGLTSSMAIGEYVKSMAGLN